MVSAADAIGFVEGALWTEGSVGTNAIGTVLVTRKPQQVNGNEHFLRNQHDWSCAAAPIRDPRTGGVLAVVNISTRAPYAHPLFVATTSAVARITSLEVQERHRRDLAALRSAGFLSQTRAHAVAFVVDQWGWIADAQGFTAPARISLPHGWQPGRQWMAVFGEVDVSAIPGGWLVQSPQTAAAPDGPQVTLHIETSVAGSSAVLRSPSRHLRVAVTPRQVQILEHLASHPEGMSAKELSDALYGRTDRVTTIRAEISRLRRSLGNAIIGNPYRFAPDVAVLGGDNPT